MPKLIKEPFNYKNELKGRYSFLEKHLSKMEVENKTKKEIDDFIESKIPTLRRGTT